MQFCKHGISLLGNKNVTSLLQQNILRRGLHCTATLQRLPPVYDNPLTKRFTKRIKYYVRNKCGVPWPDPHAFKILPRTHNVRKIPSTEESILENEELCKDVVAAINEQLEQGNQGRLFAVIMIKDRQYTVKANDLLMVSGEWAPNIGDSLRLDKVMLLGSSDFTLVGRPLLSSNQVYVKATVVEKTLGRATQHYRLASVPRRRPGQGDFYWFKKEETVLRINNICFQKKLDDALSVESLSSNEYYNWKTDNAPREK